MAIDQIVEEAADFAERTRAGLARKADHNKRESQIFFGTTIFCTLVAPLFVTLGDGILLGKVVPSVLSLLCGIDGMAPVTKAAATMGPLPALPTAY